MKKGRLEPSCLIISSAKSIYFLDNFTLWLLRCLVRYTCIKLYTPKYSRKGERNRREDQSKRFYSFNDFAKRLSVHNRRANNFPIRPLHWLSLLQYSFQYV